MTRLRAAIVRSFPVKTQASRTSPGRADARLVLAMIATSSSSSPAWIFCCSSVLTVHAETSAAGVTSVTCDAPRLSVSAMTPPM